MADWRPANSIVQLIAQVTKATPGRATSSDGTIGDDKHKARTSDHNAWIWDAATKKWVVSGVDFTHDPRHGFDSEVFANGVKDAADDRVKYIITNKKIWNPSISPLWRRYDGESPHDKHCHISIKSDKPHYDDATPWTGLAFVEADKSAPIVLSKPVLRRGSTGADVKYLQTALGLKADGKFGPATEAAVKTLQESIPGLIADGVVGQYTWAAILSNQRAPLIVTPPVLAPTPSMLPKVMGINWAGRGVAPPGYVKGMVATFVIVRQMLMEGHPAAMEMAKPLGSPVTDALAWYDEKLSAVCPPIDSQPVELLRRLFVLMFGLGMRESSGRYCEGRDTTAKIPPSSDTVEAGLFQMSWDAHQSSKEIDKLFAVYKAKAEPSALRPTFSEGVSCKAASWENVGSGNGKAFQELCKTYPEFAVQAAAIGLRNIRKHWGPITRREAEVRRDVYDLLKGADPAQPILTALTTQTASENIGGIVAKRLKSVARSMHLLDK